MQPRYLIIAAALVAILLLAFFLWPQTPGQIDEPMEPVTEGGGTAY